MHRYVAIGLSLGGLCSAAFILTTNKASRRRRRKQIQLFQSVYNGDIVAASRILSDFSPDDLSIVDEVGCTLLMIAAYEGHQQIVLILLHSGANVHTTSLQAKTKGWTALTFAARMGHAKIVEILLLWKSSPELPNNIDGEATPLMYAAYVGSMETCKLLLSYGANPLARTRDGAMAFSFAEEGGDQGLAGWLMHQAANAYAEEQASIEQKEAIATRKRVKQARNNLRKQQKELADQKLLKEHEEDLAKQAYESSDAGQLEMLSIGCYISLDTSSYNKLLSAIVSSKHIAQNKYATTPYALECFQQTHLNLLHRRIMNAVTHPFDASFDTFLTDRSSEESDEEDDETDDDIMPCDSGGYESHDVVFSRLVQLLQLIETAWNGVPDADLAALLSQLRVNANAVRSDRYHEITPETTSSNQQLAVLYGLYMISNIGLMAKNYCLQIQSHASINPHMKLPYFLQMEPITFYHLLKMLRKLLVNSNQLAADGVSGSVLTDALSGLLEIVNLHLLLLSRLHLDLHGDYKEKSIRFNLKQVLAQFADVLLFVSLLPQEEIEASDVEKPISPPKRLSSLSGRTTSFNSKRVHFSDELMHLLKLSPACSSSKDLASLQYIAAKTFASNFTILLPSIDSQLKFLQKLWDNTSFSVYQSSVVQQLKVLLTQSLIELRTISYLLFAGDDSCEWNSPIQGNHCRIRSVLNVQAVVPSRRVSFPCSKTRRSTDLGSSNKNTIHMRSALGDVKPSPSSFNKRSKAVLILQRAVRAFMDGKQFHRRLSFASSSISDHMTTPRGSVRYLSDTWGSGSFALNNRGETAIKLLEEVVHDEVSLANFLSTLKPGNVHIEQKSQSSDSMKHIVNWISKLSTETKSNEPQQKTCQALKGDNEYLRQSYTWLTPSESIQIVPEDSLIESLLSSPSRSGDNDTAIFINILLSEALHAKQDSFSILRLMLCDLVSRLLLNTELVLQFLSLSKLILSKSLEAAATSTVTLDFQITDVLLSSLLVVTCNGKQVELDIAANLSGLIYALICFDRSSCLAQKKVLLPIQLHAVQVLSVFAGKLTIGYSDPLDKINHLFINNSLFANWLSSHNGVGGNGSKDVDAEYFLDCLMEDNPVTESNAMLLHNHFINMPNFRILNAGTKPHHEAQLDSVIRLIVAAYLKHTGNVSRAINAANKVYEFKIRNKNSKKLDLPADLLQLWYTACSVKRLVVTTHRNQQIKVCVECDLPVMLNDPEYRCEAGHVNNSYHIKEAIDYEDLLNTLRDRSLFLYRQNRQCNISENTLKTGRVHNGPYTPNSLTKRGRQLWKKVRDPQVLKSLFSQCWNTGNTKTSVLNDAKFFIESSLKDNITKTQLDNYLLLLEQRSKNREIGLKYYDLLLRILISYNRSKEFKRGRLKVIQSLISAYQTIPRSNSLDSGYHHLNFLCPTPSAVATHSRAGVIFELLLQLLMSETENTEEKLIILHFFKNFQYTQHDYALINKLNLVPSLLKLMDKHVGNEKLVSPIWSVVLCLTLQMFRDVSENPDLQLNPLRQSMLNLIIKALSNSINVFHETSLNHESYTAVELMCYRWLCLFGSLCTHSKMCLLAAEAIKQYDMDLMKHLILKASPRVQLLSLRLCRRILCHMPENMIVALIDELYTQSGYWMLSSDYQRSGAITHSIAYESIGLICHLATSSGNAYCVSKILEYAAAASQSFLQMVLTGMAEEDSNRKLDLRTNHRNRICCRIWTTLAILNKDPPPRLNIGSRITVNIKGKAGPEYGTLISKRDDGYCMVLLDSSTIKVPQRFKLEDISPFFIPLKVSTESKELVNPIFSIDSCPWLLDLFEVFLFNFWETEEEEDYILSTDDAKQMFAKLIWIELREMSMSALHTWIISDTQAVNKLATQPHLWQNLIDVCTATITSSNILTNSSNSTNNTLEFNSRVGADLRAVLQDFSVSSLVVDSIGLKLSEYPAFKPHTSFNRCKIMDDTSVTPLPSLQVLGGSKELSIDTKLFAQFKNEKSRRKSLLENPELSLKHRAALARHASSLVFNTEHSPKSKMTIENSFDDAIEVALTDAPINNTTLTRQLSTSSTNSTVQASHRPKCNSASNFDAVNSDNNTIINKRRTVSFDKVVVNSDDKEHARDKSSMVPVIDEAADELEKESVEHVLSALDEVDELSEDDKPVLTLEENIHDLFRNESQPMDDNEKHLELEDDLDKIDEDVEDATIIVPKADFHETDRTIIYDCVSDSIESYNKSLETEIVRRQGKDIKLRRTFRRLRTLSSAKKSTSINVGAANHAHHYAPPLQMGPIKRTLSASLLGLGITSDGVTTEHETAVAAPPAASVEVSIDETENATGATVISKAPSLPTSNHMKSTNSLCVDMMLRINSNLYGKTIKLIENKRVLLETFHPLTGHCDHRIYDYSHLDLLCDYIIDKYNLTVDENEHQDITYQDLVISGVSHALHLVSTRAGIFHARNAAMAAIALSLYRDDAYKVLASPPSSPTSQIPISFNETMPLRLAVGEVGDSGQLLGMLKLCESSDATDLSSKLIWDAVSYLFTLNTQCAQMLIDDCILFLSLSVRDSLLFETPHPLGMPILDGNEVSETEEEKLWRQEGTVRLFIEGSNGLLIEFDKRSSIITECMEVTLSYDYAGDDPVRTNPGALLGSKNDVNSIKNNLIREHDPWAPAIVAGDVCYIQWKVDMDKLKKMLVKLEEGDINYETVGWGFGLRVQSLGYANVGDESKVLDRPFGWQLLDVFGNYPYRLFGLRSSDDPNVYNQLLADCGSRLVNTMISYLRSDKAPYKTKVCEVFTQIIKCYSDLCNRRQPPRQFDPVIRDGLSLLHYDMILHFDDIVEYGFSYASPYFLCLVELLILWRSIGRKKKEVEALTPLPNCVFLTVGRRPYTKAVIDCFTCGLIGKNAICLACANACHDGHVLSNERTSTSPCGCSDNGPEACKALHVVQDVWSISPSELTWFDGVCQTSDILQYVCHGQPLPLSFVEESYRMCDNGKTLRVCLRIFEEHLRPEAQQLWWNLESRERWSNDVSYGFDSFVEVSFGLYVLFRSMIPEVFATWWNNLEQDWLNGLFTNQGWAIAQALLQLESSLVPTAYSSSWDEKRYHWVASLEAITNLTGPDKCSFMLTDEFPRSQVYTLCKTCKLEVCDACIKEHVKLKHQIAAETFGLGFCDERKKPPVSSLPFYGDFHNKCEINFDFLYQSIWINKIKQLEEEEKERDKNSIQIPTDPRMLSALLNVPRNIFVPRKYWNKSYEMVPTSFQVEVELSSKFTKKTDSRITSLHVSLPSIHIQTLLLELLNIKVNSKFLCVGLLDGGVALSIGAFLVSHQPAHFHSQSIIPQYGVGIAHGIDFNYASYVHTKNNINSLDERYGIKLSGLPSDKVKVFHGDIFEHIRASCHSNKSQCSNWTAIDGLLSSYDHIFVTGALCKADLDELAKLLSPNGVLLAPDGECIDTEYDAPSVKLSGDNVVYIKRHTTSDENECRMLFGKSFPFADELKKWPFLEKRLITKNDLFPEIKVNAIQNEESKEIFEDENFKTTACNDDDLTHLEIELNGSSDMAKESAASDDCSIALPKSVCKSWKAQYWFTLADLVNHRFNGDISFLALKDITKQTLDAFPALHNIDLATIRGHFAVLVRLNECLSDLLPLINLTASNKSVNGLASTVRRSKQLLFLSSKLEAWTKVMSTTLSSANSSLIPSVTVSRAIANRQNKTNSVLSALSTENDFDDDLIENSLFMQVYHQLQNVPALAMRRRDQSFKVRFAGESGHDVGGLYRDLFTRICSEIKGDNTNSELNLNLFIVPPKCHVKSQNSLLPRPMISSLSQLDLLSFVGMLMGIAAMRHGITLSIDFNRLLWKVLVNDELGEADLRDIDDITYNTVTYIRKSLDSGMSPEEFNFVFADTTFTAAVTEIASNNADGNNVIELCPNGKDIRVTQGNALEYANELQAFRLHECEEQFKRILIGLEPLVPARLLPMFTWQEIEQLICGVADVDIELLAARTKYTGGVSVTQPHIKYFWQVLRDQFTPEDRTRFLRFVWGRERLSHADAQGNLFKIGPHLRANDSDNPDEYLPVSHTCFFSLDLPFYTSASILKSKLLFAMRNCDAIDVDDTTEGNANANINLEPDDFDSSDEENLIE